MATPVPTLSSSGWVTASAQKADFLLAHFYESDRFQSHLYADHITNLQFLIEQHGHNVTKLCDEIRRALEIYLGRYYDAVTVDVTPDQNAANNDPGRYTLRVYCQVREDGKDYPFGRLVVGTNSRFEKVTRLNNAPL